MNKKILYLRAVGMGDIIMSIPKWKQIHDQWDELYVLYYDFKYFAGTFNYDGELLQNIIKTSGLIKKVMYIPYNKIKLIRFIIKNFRRFDEVHFPIKTKRWIIRGKILGKKYKYVFEHADDTKKYEDIITWELGTTKMLYEYKDFFAHIERKNPLGKIEKNNKKYVTFFPSSYERSINASERKKIAEFLIQNWYNIILLWGKREQRLVEDLQDMIKQKSSILNYINKTSFDELLSLLEHADINISCNGWVMWLGHLLNQKNISIHTVSSLVVQPPIDNIHCFRIRPIYTCPKPCQALFYRYRWQQGIPVCTFYNTKKEGICRAISGEKIIDVIKKII